MQEWLDFLKTQLSKSDSKPILPINRTGGLDFEWLPGNKEEFELTINNAPPEILEGFGFKRYNSLPEGPYRQSQREVDAILEDGLELFLFPLEWYKAIPDHFPVISIFGEVFLFELGKSDNSTRAGCLSFGIPVRVQSK